MIFVLIPLISVSIVIAGFPVMLILRAKPKKLEISINIFDVFTLKIKTDKEAGNSPSQQAARPREPAKEEPSWSSVISTTIRLWFGRRTKTFLSGFHSNLSFRRPSFIFEELLATAVIFMPAAERSRYKEEYKSELWTLAEMRAGFLRQLIYTFQQLRCAIPMGMALRSERRRRPAQ